MTKTVTVTNSFTSGILDVELQARQEIDPYASSAKDLLNEVVRIQGGARTRGGTKFIAEVKNSANVTYTYPFDFGQDQFYEIEYGAGYIRFMKDRAQIKTATLGAAITNGTFVTNATGWTDISTGTGSSTSRNATLKGLNLVCGTSGLGGATQQVTTSNPSNLHVLKFKILGPRLTAPVVVAIGTSSGGSGIATGSIADVGCHTLTFIPNASSFYVSFWCATANYTRVITNISLMDNVILELETPFAQADLENLHFSQSLDVQYIQCGNKQVAKLARTNKDNEYSWSFEEVNWAGGPFLAEKTDITFSPAASAVGQTTVTASAAYFKTGMEGSLLRATHSSTAGVCRILSITDSTHAKVETLTAFGGTGASSAYREGAWSDIRGYPLCSTFFENRLWMANHDDRPDRLWGSKSGGNFEDFTPGSLDADPIDTVVNDGKLNHIYWLTPDQSSIACGTASAVFQINASNNAAITGTTIKLPRKTTHGANSAQSIYVDNVIFYASRSGKIVYEYLPDDSSLNDQYLANNILLRCPSLVRGTKVLQLAYQEEPNNVLWMRLDNGKLLALTYNRKEKVYAVTRHELGGDGFCESISCLPAPDGSQTDVWLVVRRTINGQIKRYIEIMERNDFVDQPDMFYVDCGVTYNGTATTNVTGLDHLEGETVQIFADGATHRVRTVVGGTFDKPLDHAYSKVQIGLGYTKIIDLVEPKAPTRLGTSQGRIGRIINATIHVYEMMGGRVQWVEGLLSTLLKRSNRTPLGTPEPKYTGWAKVPFSGGYQMAVGGTFRQDGPVPLNIDAVILDLEIAEY